MACSRVEKEKWVGWSAICTSLSLPDIYYHYTQARGHPGGPVRAAPRGLQGHPHRPGAVPPRLCGAAAGPAHAGHHQWPPGARCRDRPQDAPARPGCLHRGACPMGGETGSPTNAQGVGLTHVSPLTGGGLPLRVELDAQGRDGDGPRDGPRGRDERDLPCVLAALMGRFEPTGISSDQQTNNQAPTIRTSK